LLKEQLKLAEKQEANAEKQEAVLRKELKLLSCDDRKERRRHKSKERRRRSRSRSSSRDSDDSEKSDASWSGSDQDSCSDDEDCDRWCDEQKWYCYFKKRLLKDPALLAAGSDVFGSFYSTSAQMVPIASPILWENTQLSYNIDRISSGAGIIVRKDGVYMLTFSVSPSQGSQWTIFVNGLSIMTKGIASGSSQMVMFKLLELKANDLLDVRNFSSGIGAVELASDIGGSTPGTNTELVIRRVGPAQVLDRYTKAKCMRVPHKMKRMFECVKRKMLCDESLMVGGSDSYGSYYSFLGQAVAVGAPVLFENHQNMECQTHSLGSGQVVVQKSGVYNFIFVTETVQPSQFSIVVNGVPDNSTTQGINKGSCTITLRQQLKLKAGDKVEVWNYTSNAGTVTISQSPGGTETGMSALLMLFKIAPDWPNLQKPVTLDAWCNKKYVESVDLAEEKAGNISDSDLEEDVKRIKCSPYKMFRNWMLSQKCIDIDGASAYTHSVKLNAQSLNVGDGINLRTTLEKNAAHVNGFPTYQLGKRGIYEILFDSELVQPAQFAIQNKTNYIASAIAGANSGANEVVLGQLLALDRDDVLSVRNYTSFINPIVTQVNAGGTELAENSTFTMLRIAPECRKKDCKPECKKSK
jgi:hypothetical protein